MDTPTYLQPPSVIQARYELGKALGRGAMAMVYEAYDRALKRTVAMKFLAPQWLFDESIRERFKREAQAIAQLNHAHIVNVYDVGQADFWHYLVMERIIGQNLREMLVAHGGRLSLEVILSIGRGALEGLDHAHRQQIIHRDLKPENLLMSDDGQLKLADFGLALVQGEARLTQVEGVVGTLLYIAPELLLGEGASPASDIYGLGAIFYEALMGHPPFKGDDTYQVISQILHHTPRSLAPSVPPNIERWVMKMLAKSPAERYGSAAACLAEFPTLTPAAVTVEAPTELMPLPLTLHEAMTAALESERRYIAGQVEGQLVQGLNLLVAQLKTYEQVLGNNPQGRMMVGVLMAMARQLFQQAQDLSAGLYPSSLETVGIEGALEALANQYQRAHGIKTTLRLHRLSRALEMPLALAVYRFMQTAFERAVQAARASQVQLEMREAEDTLRLIFGDNGDVSADQARLQTAGERLMAFGGRVGYDVAADGGLQMTVLIPLGHAAPLTPREIEIVQELARGKTNKEIAAALHISARTVNFHLDNIYGKLGVNSRTEAAMVAMRHGWIQRG